MDSPSLQKPKNEYDDLSIAQLIELHKMEIIDKIEMRRIIVGRHLKHKLAPENNAPSLAEENNTPPHKFYTPSPPPRKRRLDQPGQESKPKKKKLRLGRPSEAEALLRKLVKNPTRRRFFSQCANKQSVLWNPEPGQRRFHDALFSFAAKDVINLCYRNNPGPLHNQQHSTVEKVVLWQVKKDRNNWAGKAPKRNPYFGTELPFDWARINFAILNAGDDDDGPNISNAGNMPSESPTMPPSLPPPAVLPSTVVPPPAVLPSAAAVPSLPRTVVPSLPTNLANSANSANSPSISQQEQVLKLAPAAGTSIDPDLMKPCFSCGKVLWLGKEENVPDDIEIACPRANDWNANEGVEPYCAEHWKKENNVMNALCSEHKAVGAERKKK